MAAAEYPVLPKTYMEFILVFIHCVTYVFNLPSYIYGLRYLSANTGNIISCLTVVLMLIPQYTILSSVFPGHRNWIEVVGVVLVLLGSSLGSIMELDQCRRKQN